MIEIDGSFGEGGGQIIRSSLALSALTGKSVHIFNIRAGRKKPGLKTQHTMAAKAAARVCNAAVEGDKIGSSEIIFEPSDIVAGHYEFKIPTAGSMTLIAQTVLPPLMMAGGGSTILFEGGTHNPWAPPFDFLQRSFLPQLAKCGPTVKAKLERPGFFPNGGGQFTLEIQPSPKLSGFELLTRGSAPVPKVVAMVSQLPIHIGQRECETICRKAGWSRHCSRVIDVEDPRGPGNVVLIELTSSNVNAIFTGVGKQGVKAESVASRVWREAKAHLASEAPVEEYLADQIILPMGLAAQQGQPSSFRTDTLSLHSSTHLDILKRFLDIDITTEQRAKNDFLISLRG